MGCERAGGRRGQLCGVQSSLLLDDGRDGSDGTRRPAVHAQAEERPGSIRAAPADRRAPHGPRHPFEHIQGLTALSVAFYRCFRIGLSLRSFVLVHINYKQCIVESKLSGSEEVFLITRPRHGPVLYRQYLPCFTFSAMSIASTSTSAAAATAANGEASSSSSSKRGEAELKAILEASTGQHLQSASTTLCAHEKRRRRSLGRRSLAGQGDGPRRAGPAVPRSRVRLAHHPTHAGS